MKGNQAIEAIGLDVIQAPEALHRIGHAFSLGGVLRSLQASWRLTRQPRDIACILLALLAAWQLVTLGLAKTSRLLYPAPSDVLAIFFTDGQKIVAGIGSAMQLLGIGVLLALAAGIVLGLITGSVPRLYDALLPIAKVISPIPPIIYTPYAVAVLPSFTVASIFVIFSSIFWQIYIEVALSVAHIDQKLLDSAKTLNLSRAAMLRHVLWPYCLPHIMNSLPLAVANAFMVLTAAEMIGATSGVGYYVRYYADFADYTRVIAGIFVIGIVVSVINAGVGRLKRAVVRWQK